MELVSDPLSLAVACPDLLRRIHNYALSVREVNQAARLDFDVLIERLDDEFEIERMGLQHEREIREAVSLAFFGGQSVNGPFHKMLLQPA